jgi:hypothetical protein
VIASHKREALQRLKTVRGHINGMVEDEAYCPDVMKQVAALQASLEKVNGCCCAPPGNLRDRGDPHPFLVLDDSCWPGGY